MAYLVDILNSLPDGFHQIERTDGNQRGAVHCTKQTGPWPRWSFYLYFPPTNDDWKTNNWRIVGDMNGN